MTEDTGRTERNRAIVRTFYEGGTQNDMGSFKALIADDFQVFAPRYLPWGGQSDRQKYIDWIIPPVAAVLDFHRLSYESITVENDHVVAFINIGVKGSELPIMISEHLDLSEGKAIKLRVAYFEPKIRLELLDLPAF